MAPMKDVVLYVAAMVYQMHTTAENARSRYASVHLSVLPPMCVSCVKVDWSCKRASAVLLWCVRHVQYALTFAAKLHARA
eukprot:20952-Heterococcus_DN1.PRE.2